MCLWLVGRYPKDTYESLYVKQVSKVDAFAISLSAIGLLYFHKHHKYCREVIELLAHNIASNRAL